MSRPAKENTDEMTADQKALSEVRYAADRAGSYICQHPRISIAALAARCARAGVPQSEVESVLDTLLSRGGEKAHATIQAAYEAAQNPATKKARARKAPAVPSLLD